MYGSIRDMFKKQQQSKEPEQEIDSDSIIVNEEVKTCNDDNLFSRLIPEDWKHLLREDLSTEAIRALEEKVVKEYEKGPVYPDQDKMFRALQLCPLQKVRVVILGQGKPQDDVVTRDMCCWWRVRIV
jgi:hypothetical protein